MKCPSCGYLSLENAPVCKKCGAKLPREEKGPVFGFDFEEAKPKAAPAPKNDGLHEAGWQLEYLPEEQPPEEEAIIEENLSPPPGPEPPPPAAPPRPSPPKHAARKPPARPAPAQPPVEAIAATSGEAVADDAPPPTAQALPTPITDAIFESIFGLKEPSREVPAPPSPAAEPIESPIEQPAPAPAEAPPAMPEPEAGSESSAEADPYEPVPLLSAAPEPAAEATFGEFRIDLSELEKRGLLVPKPAPPEEVPLFPESAPKPLESLEEVPAAYWAEEPAGVLRRAGAFVVDSAVLAVILTLFVAAAGAGMAIKGVSPVWLATQPWPLDALFPFFLLAVLLSAAYFVSFHWLGGRTPGKKLFAIRVINADAGPLPLTAAIYRWLGYLVSGGALGLGFIWALFDADGRAWHDRLSGTMVVRDYDQADKSA